VVIVVGEVIKISMVPSVDDALIVSPSVSQVVVGSTVVLLVFIWIVATSSVVVVEVSVVVVEISVVVEVAVVVV
jgi:hypothetical protein